MRRFLKIILKDKLVLVSIIFIIVVSTLSSLAFLLPYKPNDINLSITFESPNIHHIFGTDSLGRDYFTRILYGCRITLLVGFSVMIFSTILGTIIGAISGFFGGILDSVIMRILEILMSIPSFFILLALSVVLHASLSEIILVLSLFSWMGTARMIRGEVVAIKNLDFIKCAKIQGISNLKIILKHIIPNITQIIIVCATLTASGAILTEAMLSFLGLGLKPPLASLGSMLNSGSQNMMTHSYLVIFPSIFIILIVLSFNMIGRGVQKNLGDRNK